MSSQPLNTNSLFFLTKIESSGRGSYLSAMTFEPKNLKNTKRSMNVIEEQDVEDSFQILPNFEVLRNE